MAGRHQGLPESTSGRRPRHLGEPHFRFPDVRQVLETLHRARNEVKVFKLASRRRFPKIVIASTHLQVSQLRQSGEAVSTIAY